MEKQPLLPEQISPEDWENTPENVKRLVESLLASTALLESESHLTQFLDATPIGIAVHNSMGQVIYINHTGQALLGTDRTLEQNVERLSELFQVYRTNSQELYPIEELPSTRALGGETIWADDMEVRRPDRVVPLEVKAVPIFDDQAEVVYAIAVFQDISERKRLEAEHKHHELEQQIIKNTLLNSEQRYRQVIQAQTDLILRSLPDSTISFANDALCLALGRSVKDVIGSQWSSFVPPEDFDELNRKIAVLTPENPIFENTNPDCRANNQIGWTQWINLGIFNEWGKLVEIQSVGRDITALQEQIQQEQALNRVFQAVRNSLDLDTIFATATAEAAQLLKTLDCFVVQYLPQQSIWRYVAEFCHNPDTLSVIGLEISDAGNPFAAQLKQLQIVRVEDTTYLDDQINQEVAQIIPGAWLLIPLVVEGNLWGSFTITTTQQPFTWNNDQIKLAQSIAGQLEIAIHQANLYQQVQLELDERCRVEIALRASEARFRSMADNVPGVIFGYRLRVDGSDQYTYISSGFHDLYGFEPDEALQNTSVVWNMTHPDDIELLQNSVTESYQTLQMWQCQYRVITRTGDLKWLQGISRPIQQPNGDVIWDGLIIDISDRKADETRARQAAQRENLIRVVTERIHQSLDLNEILTTTVTEVHQVLQSDRVVIFQLEPDGTGYVVQESVNANWQAILGKNLADPCFQGNYVQKYFEGRVSAVADVDDGSIQLCHAEFLKQFDVRANLVAPIVQTGHLWGLLIAHQCSQPRRWSDDEIQLLKLLADQVAIAIYQASLYQQVQTQLKERIQVQNQLKHDALHDTLTGLPNRNLLMKRLELAINRAERLASYHFAVLFLDLDRFKVINDSLGHLAGDQLLITIAQKLQAPLREIDLVVRLGGDEFVILLEEIKDIQEAVRVAEQIFAALQTSLTIEGREVYVTASIGIVLGTKDYAQASHLLRDADIAMYRAKARGKARYEIFDAEMHTQALSRLHVENDLRRAIECQEFVLHYQPIVALATGNLVGFEALVRWQHPTQGLKSPAEFIPVAEETGLITLLDYWVMRTACCQLAAWQTAFPDLADLKMSVNFSAQDLQRPDLLEEVDRVLAQTRLEGRCVTLEITESMLIEDIDSTIGLLSQLKERGIQISIDDFGTGYSSLNYLHRLPVDNLKVDRSFVNQIQSGKQNYQIVETIARLSDQLELDAIAEGIETPYQLERLQDLGYKFGQGYLFSKPLNCKATEELLASKNLICIIPKL